jgi:hypothetical protein
MVHKQVRIGERNFPSTAGQSDFYRQRQVGRLKDNSND